MSANLTPKSAFLLIDVQRAWAAQSPVTLLNILSALPNLRKHMPIVHIYWGLGPRQPAQLSQRSLALRVALQRLTFPPYTPLIKPEPGDWCTRKSKENAFSNPRLAPFLRQMGVERVLVGGFLASDCVQATLFGALNNGFQTKFVSHLSSDGHHKVHMKPLTFPQIGTL